ncbi:nitroreductase family protein [Actinomycetota bacterium]
MADNFERYPAMLIPCIPRFSDGPSTFEVMSGAGSILPGAWSFMLAARDHGLGTTWTTIHLMREREAADLLGIPFDEYMQCALITAGYTVGTKFKPANRSTIDSVTHRNDWTPRT